MLMKHRDISLDQGTVHYVDSDNSLRPLLLVHGNSSSSRIFNHQLEGSLAEHYRCIAVDLPGHGQSPPPNDPATTYSATGYGALLADFAQKLGLSDLAAIGWSLGGHALLEAADRLDLSHLILTGTPPFADLAGFVSALHPEPALAAATQAELTPAERTAYAELYVRSGTAAPAVVEEDLQKTDPDARGMLGASIAAGMYTDETAVVGSLQIPLMVVQGAGDRIINHEYFQNINMPTLWQGRIQMVEDAGHIVFYEQPETFNALVTNFIESTSKATTGGSDARTAT